MKVTNGESIIKAIIYPLTLFVRLALGTMTVAARIMKNNRMTAIETMLKTTSHGFSSAAFNRTKSF